MLGLTTVEFWTIVGGVVAVVAFLGGIVIWAIRWVGAIWRRPVVLIHWWWETVISHDKRVLSPFLVVGTLRPVGEGQSRKYAYHEIERRMASSAPEREWLIRPGHRLGLRRAEANGIKVLRVVVHNQSRNKVVTPEDFGILQLETDVPPHHVHGWRYDRFGKSVLSDQFQLELIDANESQGPSKLEVTLPHGLGPDETARDDLTVSILGPQADPRVVVKKTSDLRMWVKPWRPEVARPVWDLPRRVVRWLRRASKPQIYARH